MASSGYYYSKYRQYQSEANKYRRWIEQLVDIRNDYGKRAVRKNSDEVNGKITKSKYFMETGLSGKSVYATNYSVLENSKEPQSDSDYDITTSKSFIQNEINSVTDKREYADNRKEYYYRKYREAKSAEAAQRV